MIKRDYYFILGVSRHESEKGIREAFRKLAKRYHPDIAGPKWCRQFRDIIEAYQCLSDPESRKTYNQGIAHGEEKMPDLHTTVVTDHGSDPEPLIPEPASIIQDFQAFGDPMDALLQRFARNFTGLRVPKAERPQELTVEIVLSPAQAARGGLLPIGVPSLYPCPFCNGSGRDWLFVCESCRGQGLIEEEEIVELRLPPGIRHNSVLEIPLQGLGIHNLYLKVRILIGSRI